MNDKIRWVNELAALKSRSRTSEAKFFEAEVSILFGYLFQLFWNADHILRAFEMCTEFSTLRRTDSEIIDCLLFFLDYHLAGTLFHFLRSYIFFYSFQNF